MRFDKLLVCFCPSRDNLSRLRKPIEEIKSDGDPQIAKLIADSSQGAIEGTLIALAAIEAKIDELFSDDAQLKGRPYYQSVGAY